MKVVGQTLFLGATVTDFSTSLGWGSSPSTVSVSLIEDVQPFGKVPFRRFAQNKTADYGDLNTTYSDTLPKGHTGVRTPTTTDFYNIDHYVARNYSDNHYYDCVGEDCYVDELGMPYATSTTKKEKNIPGKIYYEWVNGKFVSKYLYQEDPGFFATGTKVQPNGLISKSAGENGQAINTNGGLWIYDIINTPVYFKFDNFEFIGLVRSWERNNRPGGITYNVIIESFSSLLDSCYVILDKYGGSIFGKQLGSKGTPVNTINTNTFSYTGQLSEGNIPNIFNVYGFLESFGVDFFGGSNLNDNGISALDILQGLASLTSSHARLDRDPAFSPFGRILTKTIADSNGNIHFDIKNFGIISPSVGTNRFPIEQISPQNLLSAPPVNYNAFSLDLSDIGRLIPDYRISGTQSISNLLRVVSEANGTDFTISVIPAMVNNSLYQFVIKVISVDRTSYQSPYNIRSIVTDLENRKYAISNSSFGQETNDNITHKFIIGGPQQRLLQVKNYRLPYAQTHYIYNPILKKFITLNRPSNKARVPDVMSTRNPIISYLSLGGYIGDRININDLERNTRFTQLDSLWKDGSSAPDNVSVGRSEETIRGNYNSSSLFLSAYKSYITTTQDLNPDVETSDPNVPCVQQPLPAGKTLDTHYIDVSCKDFTPQPCPAKPRDGDGSTPCSADPTGPGGAGYYEDPTLDKYPDLSEEGFEPLTGYDQPGSRYLNLQNDWICPYFGRAFEEKMPVADDTNEYRSVRPVYLDIWTNQIVVGFSMFELPQLSIGEPLSLYDQSIFNNGGISGIVTNGLGRGGTQVDPNTGRAANKPGLPAPGGEDPDTKEPQDTAKFWQPTDIDPKRTYFYGTPGFTITESEMRAALVDFDSYLGYCLGKSRYSKPDLFMMLIIAYKSTGQLIADLDEYFDIQQLQTGDGLQRSMPGVDQQNVVFNGHPVIPTKVPQTEMNMNWSLYLNHNFVKDMQIIYEFIRSIAEKYYGKQYLVKLPDIVLYRDRQYSNIRIPGAFTNIGVYIGSSKIFYNYELTDGAWEEPGNFIDDCMMVGDNFVKVFTNDEGLITPIAGYNNSLNIDDVRQRWCQLDAQTRVRNLYHNTLPNNGQDMINELRNLIPEINTKIESATGPLTGAQRSAIDSKIEDILDRHRNKHEAEAQKQLREFGGTINCINSTAHVQIQEAWNNMWSSLYEVSEITAERVAANPDISDLPDQWADIIEDAEAASLDVELLTFGVPSLDISSLGGGDADFVIRPVSPKKEPYGRPSPRSSKLFTSCNRDRIVFMNLINFTDPRAIMTVNKLDVFDTSMAYVKDPSLSVIANIAIEDSSLYIRIKNRLNEARDARNEALEAGDTQTAKQILEDIHVLKKEVLYIRYLKNYIVPEIDPRYLVVTGPTANPSPNHLMMAPRAAHPYFFAIPLKSNQFCYGPWSNYADNVIGTPYINNLVHKVSVDVDPELTPWKYGSTSALDVAVSYKLNADVNYQTILENGTISIVGPPLFGLGGIFHNDPSRNVSGAFKFDNGWYKPYYAPYKFFDTKRDGYRELVYECIKLVHREVGSAGPLISSMNIQVSSDGITTSYRFQTYNPKTGLYSKNYEDALRQMAVDRHKFQKAISDVQKNISTKFELERLQILKNAKNERFPRSVAKFKTSLYGNSPVEIFVGQGIESLKNPVWYDHLRNENIKDAGDNPLPEGANTADKVKFLNQKRSYAWVGASMGKEIGAELLQEYNSKSAMSMDGLLSPVSFYPTKANRTYNISTYVGGSGVPVGLGNIETTCPYCYNKRVINIPYVDYSTQQATGGTVADYDGVTIGGPDSMGPSRGLNIPCPVCSRAKLDVKKEDKFPDKETGIPDVNIYSLNPIVVSSGEFRNPYASGIDRCRHSISVVGRGEYNIAHESLYIPSNINTYRDGYNPDFSRFDTYVKELEGLNVLLNQRFLALRGPLMMHGWGYDTDGYPVPNALDMPYSTDEYGRQLRFQLVDDTGNKKFGLNNLELPGKYIISENSPTPLGDVITTKYEWKGSGNGINSGSGKWNKKNKLSKKFYLNWAERPDTWPVGPIDMRWDASRRVWDASGGCKEEVLPPFIISNKSDINTLQEFLDNKTENKCPYRMINVVLEQDMIKEDNFDSTYPTRAFIDDLEYNKEPLQNNYRRLVYVIDTAGYTAPKGAKLLCRYNKTTGFYEPITKPILTAVGIIRNNQASIEMAYVQGRRSTLTPTYVTSFSNPLNLPIGTKGLFNFINGKWTLISTGN